MAAGGDSGGGDGAAVRGQDSAPDAEAAELSEGAGGLITVPSSFLSCYCSCLSFSWRCIGWLCLRLLSNF